MQLDTYTLLFAVTLAAALCTVARFVLCMLHPRLPGLSLWAWAGVAGTVGLGLVAAHGVGPNLPSQSLALLLMVGGFVMAWDGFRRFAGRKPVSRTVYTALAFVAIIPTAIAYFSHMLALQLICHSALLSVVSALAARELFFPVAPAGRAMRATGWLMSANVVLFALRTVVVFIGAQPKGPMQAGPLTYVTLLWWMSATIALTLGMVLMASERLQHDLDQQASRDPLTGALNRRAFVLLAEREQARARRNGQPLAIVMMDLDHFKKINDQFGHTGGDAVLCHFVAVLERVLRDQDVFCRFGGEEFLALLPGSGADQALVVAERIRVAYAAGAKAAIATAQPSSFFFTVSLGISEVQAGETLESAIRRADVALYRAKAAGRNRCELFSLSCPLPAPS